MVNSSLIRPAISWGGGIGGVPLPSHETWPAIKGWWLVVFFLSKRREPGETGPFFRTFRIDSGRVEEADPIDFLRSIGTIHLGPGWNVSKHLCILLSRWWFQIFFIFTPIWGIFPFWLIFFKGVETTNQLFCDIFFHLTIFQFFTTSYVRFLFHIFNVYPISLWTCNGRGKPMMMPIRCRTTRDGLWPRWLFLQKGSSWEGITPTAKLRCPLKTGTILKGNSIFQPLRIQIHKREISPIILFWGRDGTINPTLGRGLDSEGTINFQGIS